MNASKAAVNTSRVAVNTFHVVSGSFNCAPQSSYQVLKVLQLSMVLLKGAHDLTPMLPNSKVLGQRHWFCIFSIWATMVCRTCVNWKMSNTGGASAILYEGLELNKGCAKNGGRTEGWGGISRMGN